VSRAIPDRDRELVNLLLFQHRRLRLNELRNKRMPKVVSVGVERPFSEADHSATFSDQVRKHGVVLVVLPAILWLDA
jgi:hypothetical protein